MLMRINYFPFQEGLSGSGNQMESFRFLLDPPRLLSRQQVDVIWTQNRLLLSLLIANILGLNRGFSGSASLTV